MSLARYRLHCILKYGRGNERQLHCLRFLRPSRQVDCARKTRQLSDLYVLTKSLVQQQLLSPEITTHVKISNESINRCFCLFLSFLKSSSATRLPCRRVQRLTSDNFTCYHTEPERGDHEFGLSWSHYNDTDLTSKEQARGLNPRPPGDESLALSTELPPPPKKKNRSVRPTPLQKLQG